MSQFSRHAVKEMAHEFATAHRDDVEAARDACWDGLIDPETALMRDFDESEMGEDYTDEAPAFVPEWTPDPDSDAMPF